MARRRRKQRLPISQRTYAIIVLSLIELILFAIALLLNIRGIYIGAKVLGALGTIAVLASFGGMFLSIRDLFDPEYSLPARIIGLVLPSAAFVLWTGTYLIGFMSA